MTSESQVRRCGRCQSRLASDNADRLCAACRKKASDDVVRPPDVPRSFWFNEQMHAALESWHFGRIVTAYRTHPHHGRVLSQETVAGWLNLTQAQLSRIESGRAPEELSKLTHWATTLSIPSDLLWFKLPRERHATRAAAVERREAEHSAPVRKTEPALSAVSSAGLLASLTAGRLPSISGDGSVAAISPFEGMSLAESASHLLALFLQLDAQLGGDVLYAPLSQYVARMAVTVEADPSDGLLAFGQLSQLAGWLALDGNRHGAAKRYLTTAVYVGHEAGDPGLAASATAYMSLHATYRGELASALALAKTARATDESVLTPLTRTMLATREARAHAGLGNQRDCLRALDDVRTSFDRHGEREEPLWLSYVDDIEVCAQEGACYLGLGRARDAEAALSRALALIDQDAPHRVRDRVHYLSRLAKTHLLVPDVEQACFVATEALNLSEAIGSARVAERLGEFRSALSQFADSQAAQAFEERVRG